MVKWKKKDFKGLDVYEKVMKALWLAGKKEVCGDVRS